jgi:hypothetical protein
MRDKLMKLDLDRLLTIDECVELSAYARGLEAEYEHLEMDVPETVANAIAALRGEITRRKRADDEAELRKLQGALDGLKTQSERKNDVLNQMAAIQRRLGLRPAKATAK